MCEGRGEEGRRRDYAKHIITRARRMRSKGGEEERRRGGEEEALRLSGMMTGPR